MILLKHTIILGCLFIGLINCTTKNFVNEEIESPIDEFKDYGHPLTNKLQIAPRESNALNGTQLIQNITDLNLEEREDYIYNEIKKGNIPDFLRNMVRVSARISINGTFRYISYYALPDYLAIGSDNDYFLCPMTPGLGQKIADELECFLPTRRIVDQIWEASRLKMEPQPIPPTDKMTTVPVFKQHKSVVWTQRPASIIKDTLGSLVSGNKKDVIISNLVYRSPEPPRVIIYGWHYPTGKNIQPIYAGHSANYVDYSHGIRLIQNKVYVDDVEMPASEVLKSEEIKSLLSDEGKILKPFYPN
jgi:hypothetical protein